MNKDLPQYSPDGNQYEALGELKGIGELVETFYHLMDTLPEAQTIRAMHDDDLTDSKHKLIAFLSGWLGGPALFAQTYGPIRLPVAHQHLAIDMDAKNAWMLCMQKALEQLNYSQELIDKLMKKFETPAESIRLMCEPKDSQSSDKGSFYDPV